MTNKRRRERDRPKAGPELGYNPNKRVLLSYSDDEDGGAEEEEYNPESTATPTVNKEPVQQVEVANYHIPPYEDVDDDAASVGAVEESAPSNDQGILEPAQAKGPTPHHRNAHHKKQQTLGRNKSTNQKPALGSITFQFDEDGEEGFDDAYDSDTAGAMAYLRSVRAERQRLPDVLFAASEEPATAAEQAEEDDGYVSEDAYIGRAKDPKVTAAVTEFVDAREAYDSILKQRFLRQRAVLNAEPTTQNGQDDIDGQLFEDITTRKLTSIMQKTSPTFAQLQQLDEDLVLRLLSILQRRVLRFEKPVSTATSCWMWSLLAKLDVGTMNNDQVSVVREFGKRAVLISTSFLTPGAAEQLHSLDDDSVTDSDDDSTSAQDEGIDGSNTDQEKRGDTLATLDTIITVVGDVFGQRDLLEFRRPWSAEGPSDE